ncbi:MAG: hypothetical protein OXE99_00970 [Cellvibrionales bacterium]|nr:hypothetical protein [Cellvibrionales bacterium]
MLKKTGASLLLSSPIFAFAHESSIPHDHVSLGVVMAVALIGLSAVVYQRFK